MYVHYRGTENACILCITKLVEVDVESIITNNFKIFVQ